MSRSRKRVLGFKDHRSQAKRFANRRVRRSEVVQTREPADISAGFYKKLFDQYYNDTSPNTGNKKLT